ncbi:adenylosuccinate synthetase [Methanorbis rubei]|uniref:Adenylosuccinate synthetase n=1 Tax=Methanorbis rubei TaxID=3028300 RepID=A0AAE4SBN7_9EURY|nr:Adenylosuccinate synthetase [Methanocorpusculaceae archaeon Cs1]
MPSTIIVGGFFGDEGKGKIVAHIAQQDKAKIIARGGVGPNAGHTVEVGDKKYGVRMVPSGFVYPDAKLMIGSGVLVDPRVFARELETLQCGDRTFIDGRCGVIEEEHIFKDKNDAHLSKTVGSTGSGCGPANSDRVMRTARLARDVPELAPYIVDVAQNVNDSIDAGDAVIIEGTQGFGISLYYGNYPYVTSKDTSASQMAADVGVGPTKIDDVIVVFKAFPTRVGEGPFPTELSHDDSMAMGIQEFGTVTRRERRIGTWDGKMARYSAMINGCTAIAITGVDHIDKSVFGVKEYSKLTPAVKKFLDQIEGDTGCPVGIISTGPEQSQIIDIRNEL